MKKAALIVISMMLLLACNELKEGTIISMQVEPEREYMYMMPIAHTSPCGKTTITTFTYIPVMMYDDEDYSITIKGHNSENEELVDTFYVTRKSYQCLSVGDFIKVDEGCSKDSNQDQRIK